METYTLEVNLCDGNCCGTIDVDAYSEEEAIQNGLDYVCRKLAEALPELSIDVTVNLVY